MKLFHLCFLALFFTISVFAQDLDSEGTTVKVLGQSGKISLTRENKIVTIDFDSMVEKDATGETVGMTGALNDQHGVNSFATQSFTFSQLSVVNYKNLSFDTFTFESPINSIGKLKCQVFIAKENGTITDGDDTFSVSNGDVKWNIEIPEWTFLINGAFIDLDVEIKTKSGEEASGSGKSFSVGNAQLKMASSVLKDNQTVPMPATYPKMISKGNKKIFTFRFAKFSNSLLYDPMFNYGDAVVGAALKSSLSLSIVGVIVMSVLMFT